MEEFLKLKPNIKVTPIKKEKPTQQQQQQQQQTDQYQNSQSVDENSPVAAKKPKINFILTSPSQNITQSLPQLTPAPQHATNTTNNTQAQPQIQLQLQSFAQQQLSQQLFSNLAPLLQQQPQLAAALPQLTTANTQPQIQLQLQPTFTDQQHNQQLHHSQQQLFSNLAPILQQQILQANPSAQTMLSPNKCFLPITIKDENSDQQIVAHIDAKNFILPTTYQLQMKVIYLFINY